MVFQILQLLVLGLLPVQDQSPAIVPSPKSISIQQANGFTLDQSGATRIYYETREAPRSIERSLKPMADVLASELEIVTGNLPDTIEVANGEEVPQGSILLKYSAIEGAFAVDEAAENQAYRLKSDFAGVTISSQYSKGVSYGTATLVQVLKEGVNGFGVDAMDIEDAPAAQYRAVMLDIARQPHSIEVIKDLVRMARLYKMRYIQLHLTDDQLFTFPFEPVTSKLPAQNKVYSREALAELVRYADARGVTLIPELDLPGHSTQLIKSGYLDPSKNDADVADPANFDKITAIVDDILSVFSTSPYFHIGGDESGAGDKLIPFLQHINKHLRQKPRDEQRRMLVWEGFHGSPTEALPPAGDDRIVVLSWESSYNPPWALLESGYEIINASWKPTYVCGGCSATHPGNTSGRRFTLQDIFRWKPSLFMHWEPGRPIYEDRGPQDEDKNDGQWDASVMKRNDQILGGQLLYWEQNERAVIESLRQRIAVISQRLWNPDESLAWEDFQVKMKGVSERVMTIVQPVLISPEKDPTDGPIVDFYNHYDGDTVEVSFSNRTKIEGDIRIVKGRFQDDIGYFRFPDTAYPDSNSEIAPDTMSHSGGFSIVAKLFRKDGTAVDGMSWAFYNNWPMRVTVTEYEIGRYSKPTVDDLAALPEDRVLRRHQLPMLRGPLRNVTIRAQMVEAMLTAPGSGDFTISSKTQSGHASVYLDLNQNGKWEANEKLIVDTPNSEKPLSAMVKLREGERYRLRVDHNTGIPRPVLTVKLDGPGTDGDRDVTPHLSLCPSK